MFYLSSDIKGRIVKNKDEIWFYYCDGTYAKATNHILKNILCGYRQGKGLGGYEYVWNKFGDQDILWIPGETMALFTEECLIIYDASVFTPVLSQGNPLDYITAAEYAKEHGCSVARIKKLCGEDRITGAIKISGKWFIYRNADYPMDKRIYNKRNGKE